MEFLGISPSSLAIGDWRAHNSTMLKSKLFLCSSLLAVALTAPSFGQKEEMKEAGKATKEAAKQTGKAVEKTAKKAGKETKKGVNKAAEKTKDGAKKVEEKTKP